MLTSALCYYIDLRPHYDVLSPEADALGHYLFMLVENLYHDDIFNVLGYLFVFAYLSAVMSSLHFCCICDKNCLASVISIADVQHFDRTFAPTLTL